MPYDTNEQLSRPNLRGPLSSKGSEGAAAWDGTFTVPAGSAYSVQSSPLVNSDSLIFTTLQTHVASDQVNRCVVGSISPGVSIYFAMAAPAAADTKVHWTMLKRT